MSPQATSPSAHEDGPLADGVLVVGAGLIGTSMALALRRAGVSVWLSDKDWTQAALAADLGGGTAGTPEKEPALVAVAVPVPSVSTVIQELARTYINSSFTDVGSVKSHVQVEIERVSNLSTRFVGGHPMAGRERSGAAVADPDLFVGRPWILTPSRSSSHLARVRAEALVAVCGGELQVTGPERHDLGVALVSHAPQVAASLLAGRLAGAASDLVALAGPGLRDTTRIADSDPRLWTGILSANAGAVVPVLEAVASDLEVLTTALRQLDDEARKPYSDKSIQEAAQAQVLALLDQGRRGRARLPGKHGGRASNYAVLQVVVSDEPGQLARLFTAADEVGVNVEDVAIEHAAGHPVGVVELSVVPAASSRLAAALHERGWPVHSLTG